MLPKGDFTVNPTNVKIEELKQLIYDRPTKSDVALGFDSPGATTVPRTPTILRCYSNHNTIHIVWERQDDLTNFSHYEVQVSEGDSRPWYALSFDGEDWKDDDFDYEYWSQYYEDNPGAEPLTMNDQNTEDFTIIYTPYIEHCNIPYNADKTGKKLYYRVRTVTRDDIKSLWSDETSATTRLIQTDEYLTPGEYIYIGGGDLNLSGEAFTANYDEFITSGGLTMSGSAEVLIDFEYTGGGNLNLDGNVESELMFDKIMTGVGSLDIGGGAIINVDPTLTFGSTQTIDLGTAAMQKVVWLTVSGTAITLSGTDYDIGSSSITFVDADRISDTSFIVSFADSSEFGVGTVKIATVSGTTITFGDAQVFYPLITNRTSIAMINTSKVMVSYRKGSDDKLYARHGDISGGTITWQTETKISNNPVANEQNLNVVSTGYISYMSCFTISYNDDGTLKLAGGYISAVNTLIILNTITIEPSFGMLDYDISVGSSSSLSAPIMVSYYHPFDNKSYITVVSTSAGYLILSSNKTEMADIARNISISNTKAVLDTRRSYIVSYNDSSDGNRGKAVSCSIDLSTNWTNGTPTERSDASTFYSTSSTIIDSDYKDNIVIVLQDNTSGDYLGIVGEALIV